MPVKVAGEYDLETTFTRREGKDTLAIVLPVGSHACDIALSSWEGQAHGLEAIDGQDSRSNPTTRSPARSSTDSGTRSWRKYEFGTNLPALQVLLDNAPLFRWQGKETSWRPGRVFPSPPGPDRPRRVSLLGNVPFGTAASHLGRGFMDRTPKGRTEGIFADCGRAAQARGTSGAHRPSREGCGSCQSCLRSGQESG